MGTQFPGEGHGTIEAPLLRASVAVGYNWGGGQGQEQQEAEGLEGVFGGKVTRNLGGSDVEKREEGAMGNSQPLTWMGAVGAPTPVLGGLQRMQGVWVNSGPL